MDTSELDGWIANLAPIYLQPEVIDGFVQRIDDAIAVANPEVAGDRELRRDVDASTAAQLRVTAVRDRRLVGERHNVDARRCLHRRMRRGLCVAKQPR